MILWFLHLFQRFNELEREVYRLELLNEQAHSLLISVQGQLGFMTDAFGKAQRSEIESTRRVADAFARRHGGPVFDIAGEIPVRPEEFEPIPRSKAQASNIVEQMEREFYEATLQQQGQFTSDVRR